MQKEYDRHLKRTRAILFTSVIVAVLFVLPGLSLINYDPVRQLGTGNLEAVTPHGTVFSPNSFWNLPLPAYTPVSPNSNGYVASMLEDLKAYAGHGDINTGSYTPPIYTVGTDVPRTAVKFNNCQNKSYVPNGLLDQLKDVPIPAYAVQSPGTDAEIAIYQPGSDSVWEMWGARHDPNGSWYACWGGKLTNVSKSDGIFPPYYGVTATGLSMLGGTIRADELKAGEINHVIGVSFISNGVGNVWPANRYDGYAPNPPHAPEGTRFRIDPKLDLNTVSMTPAARTIAKAAQKYGMVLWDKSGVVGFRAENAAGFTTQGQPNPYPSIFNNVPSYNVLAGFPWSKLQALPAGYGQNGLPVDDAATNAGTPVVSAGTSVSLSPTSSDVPTTSDAAHYSPTANQNISLPPPFKSVSKPAVSTQSSVKSTPTVNEAPTTAAAAPSEPTSTTEPTPKATQTQNDAIPYDDDQSVGHYFSTVLEPAISLIGRRSVGYGLVGLGVLAVTFGILLNYVRRWHFEQLLQSNMYVRGSELEPKTYAPSSASEGSSAPMDRHE